MKIANNLVLVGRIKDMEEIANNQDKKILVVTIAVPRAFKNEQGEYETDFIPCVLWKAIAENIVEYCKKGDLVGIKGRLQVREDKVEVVAEKVTFLSNGSTKE